MIKNLLLAATTVFILTACMGEAEPQEWTSFIYPDKTNQKRSMESGIYPSLKICQEASIAKLKTLDLQSRGDYRCGLDCQYHEGMKTQICKQMKK